MMAFASPQPKQTTASNAPTPQLPARPSLVRGPLKNFSSKSSRLESTIRFPLGSNSLFAEADILPRSNRDKQEEAEQENAKGRKRKKKGSHSASRKKPHTTSQRGKGRKAQGESKGTNSDDDDLQGDWTDVIEQYTAKHVSSPPPPALPPVANDANTNKDATSAAQESESTIHLASGDILENENRQQFMFAFGIEQNGVLQQQGSYR